MSDFHQKLIDINLYLGAIKSKILWNCVLYFLSYIKFLSHTLAFGYKLIGSVISIQYWYHLFNLMFFTQAKIWFKSKILQININIVYWRLILISILLFMSQFPSVTSLFSIIVWIHYLIAYLYMILHVYSIEIKTGVSDS